MTILYAVAYLAVFQGHFYGSAPQFKAEIIITIFKAFQGHTQLNIT